MIYDGLLLKQNFGISDDIPDDCRVQSWPDCVHLIFMITQTYFIFKHSQVNIRIEQNVLYAWMMNMQNMYLNARPYIEYYYDHTYFLYRV